LDELGSRFCCGRVIRGHLEGLAGLDKFLVLDVADAVGMGGGGRYNAPFPLVSQIGILTGMSTTTIKVDSSVRDRLALVARARGTTMGALLDSESRRLEAEQRLAAIETSYRRLQREDPAGWQEYLAELGELTAGEPDATVGEEWPEYNA
jgi:hypothetical protein